MNETELKAFNQIIAASYSPAELRKLYRRSNPGLPLSIELDWTGHPGERKR
ncbi:hypothetical protein DD5_78 [Mycobacterium phage DD5]|uniref:Uncharacterized protein n=1 Tax=Mycobacterium phage DD5 TaxID=540064 RepID=B3VH60_9CAUD|nr:hypothetical protein DD5_78 [Mycobacterium phage DD5]ACE80187.1 hypothetical protein DD5_78 [Mycobacterium phage DD5]